MGAKRSKRSVVRVLVVGYHLVKVNHVAAVVKGSFLEDSIEVQSEVDATPRGGLIANVSGVSGFRERANSPRTVCVAVLARLVFLTFFEEARVVGLVVLRGGYCVSGRPSRLRFGFC